VETRRIPLFPLNVVLFPGMVLPLHIFEPRYQAMIHLCLEGDRTFGVCLIRSGDEVGGPADPYSVGTTCEIIEAAPLEEGRMNLATIGRRRFRVRRLFHEQPFLEAEVELLPAEAPGDLGNLSEQVRAAAGVYIQAVLALRGESAEAVELPDDPVSLSHLVGAVLPASLPLRQELLETESTERRLELELELLQRELEQLAEASRISARQPARPMRLDPDRFSPN